VVSSLFPFSILLDLLCPPSCPLCGNIIENSPGKDNPGNPFCSDCLQKIVTPDGQFCRRCGGRRFVSPDNVNPGECLRCRTAKFRFRRAIALGEYANDLRLLTLRMKTDQTGILAVSAARMLANYRRADLESVGADYIVPVAMHRLRRLDRGVNSPDLLAEELGQQLKIPVAPHIIRRIRPTDLQYTLSHRARAENVADAFALRAPGLWERLAHLAGTPVRSTFAGKTVLLVDDILTTGSTCNEVTKVLLAAGVRSVTVAVLARAEGGLSRSTG